MNASVLAAGRYLVVGLLGFGGGWGGRELLAQKRQSEWQAQQRAKQVAAETKKARDSVCVLALRNGGPSVPIFESLTRATEFAGAAQRGEPQATLELILKDAAGFVVDSGTRCSLIGGDYSGAREVRIVEGRYQGKTGFVLNEWRTPE